MTTTWNDSPPASPPTTDTDPCVAWGAETGHHGHPHDHRPPLDHATAAAPPTWTFPQWEPSGLPTPPPEARPQITRRGRGARVVAGAVAVAALLGAGFTAGALLDDGTTVASGPVPTTAAALPVADPTPLVEGDAEEPVAAVAEALGPSVVKIQTQDGVGSGVVYDESGLILTNAHVVSGARAVQVVFSDGTSVDGEVLGADSANDIAVVQVAATESLVVARLADEPARVGQLAVAVGSPFGLEQTVTSGVVSAVDRPVQGGDGTGVVGMLQTDAPINPGNSGGALANRQGEVIGINSMIFSQNGENNGIGFAIPIDRAKEIADALVDGGSVDRGYLGVSSQAPTSGEAGAEIRQVEPGSPAAAAGLEVGDVIVRVEGTAIKASGDLAVAIGTHQPGEAVTIEVVRDGSTTEITVTLGSR